MNHSAYHLNTPQGKICYTLVRSSRRKTIAIQIDQKLNIKVFAPQALPVPSIEDFISEKSGWVFKKIKDLKKKFFSSQERSYGDQQKFLFLGRFYRLNYLPIDKKRISIDQQGDALQVHIPLDLSADLIETKVRQALRAWYQAQAKEVLAGRIFHLSRKIGVDPNRVSVRGQKRIWGSCHYHQRNIHLNWKMVMAPLEVIDYIVIHELCHLQFPNHSKRFWHAVQEICPTYMKSEQWLKDHAGLMILN